MANLAKIVDDLSALPSSKAGVAVNWVILSVHGKTGSTDPSYPLRSSAD